MNTKGRLRKLLGQPAVSTAPNDSGTGNTDLVQVRPSASQSTTYSANTPIQCLDRSPDGRRAVIAGAKVFKILRVDGSAITEDLDLRALITSHASGHDLSAATPDQLNIKSVKWSHKELDTTIITASENGRITVYDLNRAGEGLEVARIQEHTRQVHSLAISPFKSNWLLSASQDGTVRSFDIRTPSQGRNGPSFRTWQIFRCNADAVRDVKWSPTDGMEFACCTDAGIIQKWDIRKPTAPVLRLSAHQSACFSISWHPDGEHLISGGIDQQCLVWDLSKTADRNQKPGYAFTTPAPVSTVSWRPACWSATAQGRRAAQVTVAYDDSMLNKSQSANVHLWDLARPAMPFKEVEQWDSAPTGLLWNTRDLLWSVDREGHFVQTDLAFVSQLIERRSLSTFAFSPTGDALMLLEARQAPRRPRPSINTPEASPGVSHGGSGPILSVSRSDSEEDVVGSFLGPRQRKSHRRRNSGRNNQHMSTTPPTVGGISDTKVMSLNDAVKVTGSYKPQQVMAIGHVPSAVEQPEYQYFTDRYLLPIAESLLPDGDPLPINVRNTAIMESYAKAAEEFGRFRLAQTWRLLSYTTNLLLERRAEYHRQARLTAEKNPSKVESIPEVAPMSKTQIEGGHHTPRKLRSLLPRSETPVESHHHHSGKSTIAENLESTSNVTTPLVRPVRDHGPHGTRQAMHTSWTADEDDASDFRLPEALVQAPSPRRPIPVPGTASLPGDISSSVEGYDFYGMESFTPAGNYTAPLRKQPLRLDYVENHDLPKIHPPLRRHDSGESFQMFSTSGDSQVEKFALASDTDGHSSREDTDPSLRDRVASWENSQSPDAKHRPGVGYDAPTQLSDGYATSEEMGRGLQYGMPHIPSLHPIFRVQEASAPWNGNDESSKVPAEQPLSPTSEKPPEDPNIISSDWLPQLNDPPFLVTPLDPIVLVRRTIDFECQTGTLNAAAMVLLLRPLLPSNSVDEFQARAILKQYHLRLNSMSLFTQAALLRNLCVPTYPDIFGLAQRNVTIGFFCTDCGKPIENDPTIPNSMWRCPRCAGAMDSCAICLSRNMEVSPFLLSLDGTAQLSGKEEQQENIMWFLCPGCGHGGHVSCMRTWHEGPDVYSEGNTYSDGCCPLEGCLHPCLPGKWREERVKEKKIARDRELDKAVKENSRPGQGRGGMSRGVGVRRDVREVGQSRAVDGVRVALGVGGNVLGGSGSRDSRTERPTGAVGGGRLSSDLERKKSVKLLAPGEER